MQIKNSYTFGAPRQVVWDLLMDTARIAGCIPGCEGLEPLGDDRFRARLTVGLAAVTGTYEGTVTMADKQPPHSYRLLVEGSGRPGFVTGEAHITLADAAGSTLVTVEGDAQIGGAIARVGQRLMTSAGRMMMDRFFACLRASIDRRPPDGSP